MNAYHSCRGASANVPCFLLPFVATEFSVMIDPRCTEPRDLVQ